MTTTRVEPRCLRGWRARIACAITVVMGMTSTVAAGGVVPLTTELVASGLDHVTFVTHAPDDVQRLYIVEKQGRIKVLNLVTGAVNATLFLDIDVLVGGGLNTPTEQGLLGLAFHPDFQANRTFYVNYTDVSGNTVVAAYTAPSADVANPTGDVILTFTQPFANHNGGWLGFGPLDGYLYIATGDGGGSGDGGNNGQTITNNLLGKILRIDVNGDDFPADPAADYAIPSTNPFVGAPGDDEIWTYGLRHPWRCSFDRETGDLYIGDVGQVSWEEIDRQPANSPGGENYGWRCREGAHPFNDSGPCVEPFVEPVYEYGHGVGSCVTGGYVYRGCAIPSLRGHYFLADYSEWLLWSFRLLNGTVVDFTNRTQELAFLPNTISRIASFGEDARGELYIVDQGLGDTGEIYRIVPVTSTHAIEDLDCDGTVGFSDILLVITGWGPCSGCLADVDGDGEVAFADILQLILNWG